MITVEHEVDRFLTLLRNKIRERGFTQLEVQEALGWGRSYISQLLTKQKSLRLEQVLLILNVIGTEPRAFFGELYGDASSHGLWQHGPSVLRSEPDPALGEVKALVHGLAELLLEKGFVTAEELSSATATQREETG